MSLSLRGIRDGALLGVLLYALAYALFQLRDILIPHLSSPLMQDLLNQNQDLIASIGMAGVGYFVLAGAALGAIPWGSLFGAPPKRKRA